MTRAALRDSGRVTDANELDAHEQVALLRRREISAAELLDAHLDAVDRRNGEINALVAVDPDVGRRRAAAVDAAIAAGNDPGPLAGLVTAHKDLTETADFPTTYGSPVFAGHRPRADSLLVERMTAAGVVAIAKTNTPEFGKGSHTFNPVYGVTRNPHDPSRSSGGSSGGAAAALATHMVAVADGSDFGGSLRNPAAWNGVVGFRPSLGVVPDLGPGNPYVRLGVAGPMARTVDDAALLFGVLARPDRRDPACRGLAVPARIDPADRPVRVAWSDDLGGLPVERDVTAALHSLRARIERLGWTVVDAEPDFAGADECFETIRSWDVANGPISRLGDRTAEVKATVRDELARGRCLDQQQVAAAIAHLAVLWRRAVAFFDEVDLLVGPVTQLSPFPVEWEYPTEVAGVTMDRYLTWMRSCSRITALQLPAMSLPAGTTDAGLPVGAQLIGSPRGDLELLRAAKALEHAAA